MGEIVFVGLGLNDEMGMSLRGLEEAKTADTVFIELYTSLMPNLSLRHLERISGNRLRAVSRKELEEENGKAILEAAEKGKTVLLVPGDPLIATTHVALRIEAAKRGVRTRIVHGASITSAVVGLSGLHNYKFGKSVTVPFPEETPSETPYEVVAQNQRFGLHTLCLLDIKAERKRCMTVREALEALLAIEKRKREKVITANTLAVGIARAGSSNPTVKADFAEKLAKFDFGDPPHTLVLPGKLHFMEAEALVALAAAPSQTREMVE